MTVPGKTVSATRKLLVLLAGLLIVQAVSAGQWGNSYFPNYLLTNQDGQILRFYDDVIKGKVVAVNFMYTSCKDVCPVETAKLREVQRRLADRVGKDIFMYSITIDPEHDTPEVLKAYMKQFKIGPGWQFLTGNKEEIQTLQKRFGLYSRDIQEIDPLDHNVSLVMGNEVTGRWVKRTPYDDVGALTDFLGYSLSGNRRRPGTVSYASAGEVADFSRGQYLFKTRCTSCHTIGGGDQIGPDLHNVTTVRDRAWLHRWIKEPDVVLAEKDPLATALVAKFNNLPMPNLALNDVDADALIDFLDAASRGSAQTAAETPAAK